jgi:hypothetical protein
MLGLDEALLEMGEFRLATHEQTRGGSGTVGERLGESRRSGDGQRRGTDEPIPEAMHRLNKLRGPGSIAQHLAQLAHIHRQCTVTHHRPRPEAFVQLVLGDYPARVLD